MSSEVTQPPLLHPQAFRHVGVKPPVPVEKSNVEPPLMHPLNPAVVQSQIADAKRVVIADKHPLASAQSRFDKQPDVLPDIGDVVHYGSMGNPSEDVSKIPAHVVSIGLRNTLNLNVMLPGFFQYEANVPFAEKLQLGCWSWRSKPVADKGKEAKPPSAAK